MAEDQWEHLKLIARKLTSDYPDAVFIGGVAVFVHALTLGEEFQESSHDADLYLSLSGKSDLRERYEVRRSPHLDKDSVLIEGEDIDLYVEHQHGLGVAYDAIAAWSQVIEHVRVASLEHLLVLKLDAARDRQGTGKGEKDVRDIARIVALLDSPRTEVLALYRTDARLETLDAFGRRRDIPRILGLNAFQGSRFQKTLDERIAAVRERWNGPERGRTR